MKKLLTLIAINIFSSMAFAQPTIRPIGNGDIRPINNIQLMINQCERAGGGACMYDILRALATKPGLDQRINRCQMSGGGACVYNILRVLAGADIPDEGEDYRETLIGNYVKQSGICSLTSATVYQRTKGFRRIALVIDWNRDPRQRYIYNCNGGPNDACGGSDGSITLTGPNTFLYSGNIQCGYIRQ